jgi:osmotically-inducible protein OsmY
MRTWNQGLITILAVVALVWVVAGCTATQSPGRQGDDHVMHAAVKAERSAERFSHLLNVDVHRTNGVVPLAGEVPNAQVKAEAEREAQSVSGVVGVQNHLQVKAPPAHSG